MEWPNTGTYCSVPHGQLHATVSAPTAGGCQDASSFHSPPGAGGVTDIPAWHSTHLPPAPALLHLAVLPLLPLFFHWEISHSSALAAGRQTRRGGWVHGPKTSSATALLPGTEEDPPSNQEPGMGNSSPSSRCFRRIKPEMVVGRHRVGKRGRYNARQSLQ